MLKKIHGWKLPIVAFMALAFALISVLGRASEPVKEPFSTPPTSQFIKTVAGIGVVEPVSEIVAISPEISGVVRHIFVKIGDQVKKGDALFTVDQREIEAQINVLDASLKAAEVQIKDARAQFSIVQNLVASKAISKDEINKRQYGLELAIARAEEMKAQLQQARITKERLVTRAPMNGQILEMNIREGEFAAIGSLASPLMRMGDVSRLHVRVEFDEENAEHIKQEAHAHAQARGSSAIVPISFQRFEPYIKPKQNLAVAGQRVDTRVLQVIYMLPSDANKLLVGQQVDVYVEKK
ncbi:MAG: efflux RND transporter periplasmic adaptor subunit [Alphaproteobacteria bacterium]